MNPYYSQSPYGPSSGQIPKGFKAIPHEPHTYCGMMGGEQKHLVMHKGGYTVKPHTTHFSPYTEWWPWF